MTAPTPPRGIRPLPIILAAVGLLVLLGCGGIFVGYYLALDTGPDVTITACKPGPERTRIEFTAHNNTTEAAPFRLRFRALDATGRELSIGTEYVWNVQPNETSADSITLEHHGSTSASCEYVGVE